MKFFIMIFVFSLASWAQTPRLNVELEDYFSDKAKSQILPYLERKINSGCSKPRSSQPGMGAEELDYRVSSLKALMEEKFSQAFSESPKIKEAFYQELDKIKADPSCLEDGNTCRSKLVATSIYYYQNLRPDIPNCHEYVSKEPMTKGYDGLCEIEIKYRKERLDFYGRANGGMDSRGVYTDQLINELNATTQIVLRDVLSVTIAPPKKRKPEIKDPVRMYICDDVVSGTLYQFPLRMNLYKDPLIAFEPGKVSPSVPKKVETNPCVEEKLTLYSEFVPMNFEEGRSTVGADQIDPVKAKIQNFIAANPNMMITDISVTSSSSRTPFYISKGVIDPQSDQRNIDLAKQRADFAQKALEEIKKSRPELEKVVLETKSALAGPAFEKIDLNQRFVTKMTPGYKEKVAAIYAQYKDLLEKEALVKSSDELMDESRFSNLYQAKYKPFQGFRINISGYKKEMLKCSSIVPASKPSSGSPRKATDQ